MNNASLELGGTNWAEKDGNILGYSVGDTSGKYSPQEFTFARGSNLSATRIDRAGLIVKGRENVLLQSNQFDTTWVNSGTTETGGQSGYDGTNDAWLLSKTIAQSFRYIAQPISQSGVSTASIYVKAGTLSVIALFGVGGTNPFVSYNVALGTILTQRAGVIDSKITDVGNGWYRCSMTFSDTITTLNVYPDWDGTNVGTIYIQDAQLELGLAASPYIETTTTSAQAGVLENTPRLNYTTGVANPYLLLEPSRSNVIAQSEYYNTYWNINDVTIEDNSAISPEGLQNASKMTEAATNARHRLGSGSTTLSTSGVYIASVFIKKGTARYGFVHFSGTGAYTIVVDLEDGTITDTTTNGTIAYQNVEDYGNGWYRCSVGGDITAGTASYLMQFGTAGSAEPTYFNYVPIFLGSTSNNIYTYGATLEAGSYPTSYIPTYSVSATRAADTCYKTDAGGEIGQTEGTIFWEGKVDGFNVFSEALPISLFPTGGTTSGAQIYITFLAPGNIRYVVYDGTVLQCRITTANNFYTLGGYVKIAAVYKANDFALYINGTQIGTETSGSVVACGEVYFDYQNYVGKYSTDQVALYKERLTNAELATLTTI